MRCVVLCGIGLLLTACAANSARPPAELARVPADLPLWEQAAGYATLVGQGVNRAARLAAALEGLAVAKRCVAEHPSRPACYYQRAVLTGLYYQSKVIGYQDGLKSMIADCEQVLALDATHAGGGAYRILAEIYTQVPATATQPDHVVRDLPRARKYLERALMVAPGEVANHVALCDTLVAMGRRTSAVRACTTAEQLLAARRESPQYRDWSASLAAAKKRLEQAR